MVPDDDVVEPARETGVGGPSASRYFLMVALFIPNSRSIARNDIPMRWLSESPSISPTEGTSACAPGLLRASRQRLCCRNGPLILLVLSP